MSNYVVMPKADWQDALDAIREKNGSTEKYTSDQVGGVIRSIQSAQSTLQVTTIDNAVVTISKDGQSYTATGPVAVFENLQSGVWTVKVEAGNGLPVTVEVEVGSHEIEVYPFRIVGISRDITSASPTWARTDGAVGLTVTASVGTSAGHSDFDTIYPWSDIERVTLATGDVMVRIPKFYYQRYREGNVEHIRIAGYEATGFSLHPLFNHGGVESECAYVGAYKTSGNNKSVTGALPTGSATRSVFRSNAKNKGSGWGIIDIAAVSAIQMLILVEFANNNVQAVIGRGYCDGNSAALASGACDSVPNLTGRTAGTDGKTGVVYRGIENFWGNTWEWVDGINFNGGKYYICNDISKYVDDTATNYEQLSFTGATNWSQSYITQEGLDTGDNDYVMLPYAAGSGSATTYQCDACWSSTGWMVLARGGDWPTGSVCGLFAVSIGFNSSGNGSSIGSRLLYIPS